MNEISILHEKRSNLKAKIRSFEGVPFKKTLQKLLKLPVTGDLTPTKHILHQHFQINSIQ